jgi:xanthine dehydrogenase accessory factor
MSVITLIRGGGDLASGVALRLQKAGLRVMITELPRPLVVRRMVSFAEAVHRGVFTVEGVTARRVNDLDEARHVMRMREIPVLVDPDCKILPSLIRPVVLVDGRMTKTPGEIELGSASLVIGLGPGFLAGENCHAAIETKRGHYLGRVIWEGSPEADTGIPEGVAERGVERVLRAPADGTFVPLAEICSHVELGGSIGAVSGQRIEAPFAGVLRGLLHEGTKVTRGMKIGDLDPRDIPEYCRVVSDKSLAIGGGVLEAILSRAELRPHLWD